jgi:hypothetical protein
MSNAGANRFAGANQIACADRNRIARTKISADNISAFYYNGFVVVYENTSHAGFRNYVPVGNNFHKRLAVV